VLEARYRHLPLSGAQISGLVIGCGLALAISVAVIVVPLRIAVRRIEEIDH
jgi:hypothetical protein